MKIQESAENYLETILMLSQRGTDVRSIDIANELDFSKPSVSIAMKNLRENGYIEMDDNGHITLLPPGRKLPSVCMSATPFFPAGLPAWGWTQKPLWRTPAALSM